MEQGQLGPLKALSYDGKVGNLESPELWGRVNWEGYNVKPVQFSMYVEHHLCAGWTDR